MADVHGREKNAVSPIADTNERVLEKQAFIPNYRARAGTIKPSAMKYSEIQIQQSDYNR